MQHFIEDAVGAMVTEATLAGEPYDWDLEALWNNLRVLYPVTLTPEDLIEEAGGDQGGLTAEMLKEEIVSDALVAYERREEYLGATTMRDLERRVVLSSIGRKWQEHLYEMDYLKEGIGLRAMAQRDPLVEYQREGYEMFEAMMEGIREDSVSLMFHAEVEPGHDAGEAKGAGLMDSESSQEDLEYSAPDESGEARTRRTRSKKDEPKVTGKQARKAKKNAKKRR